MMTTRSTRTRIALAAVTHVPAVAAASPVDDASAALTFWMTWGLVYFGIAVGLMAVATAAALRERRAWTALLRWAAKDEPATEAGDTAAPDPSRRAA
jgi:hypothetical protein